MLSLECPMLRKIVGKTSIDLLSDLLLHVYGKNLNLYQDGQLS